MTSGRRAPTKAFAPAAERNRKAIGDVLKTVLPPTGVVLEIASGTGQHAEHLSATLPGLRWQPSDISERALDSIEAHVADAGRSNFLRPIRLDVTDLPWPILKADAILCINMIHVAPWEASVALFAGAETMLERGEVLVTYGPYREHGRTAPSNEAFDQSLRRQNPAWGLRDVDDLEQLAREHAFLLTRSVQMPANNLTLVWERTPRQDVG